MDKILDEEKKTKEAYKKLKELDGEELRKELINLTLSAKDGLIENYKKVNMRGQKLLKYIPFKEKYKLSIQFWEMIYPLTFGKVSLDINQPIVIANKVLQAQDTINKFFLKENLKKEEILELLGSYKAIFETILKIIAPYFKPLIEKKENLYWSDILYKLNKIDKSYKKLFKSMDGYLRDVEGHSSSYIGDNKFIWIKDGLRKDYEIKKIYDKTEDLFILALALSSSISEVFIDKYVEFYKKLPIEKVKYVVDLLPI